MKVYVVINEALYPDSGYNDIVSVCDNIDSAVAIVRSQIHDLRESIDKGENAHFTKDTYELTKSTFGLGIRDDRGYYDNYRIEIHELI